MQGFRGMEHEVVFILARAPSPPARSSDQTVRRKELDMEKIPSCSFYSENTILYEDKDTIFIQYDEMNEIRRLMSIISQSTLNHYKNLETDSDTDDFIKHY